MSDSRSGNNRQALMKALNNEVDAMSDADENDAMDLDDEAQSVVYGSHADLPTSSGTGELSHRDYEPSRSSAEYGTASSPTQNLADGTEYAPGPVGDQSPAQADLPTPPVSSTSSSASVPPPGAGVASSDSRQGNQSEYGAVSLRDINTNPADLFLQKHLGKNLSEINSLASRNPALLGIKFVENTDDHNRTFIVAEDNGSNYICCHNSNAAQAYRLDASGKVGLWNGSSIIYDMKNLTSTTSTASYASATTPHHQHASGEPGSHLATSTWDNAASYSTTPKDFDAAIRNLEAFLAKTTNYNPDKKSRKFFGRHKTLHQAADVLIAAYHIKREYSSFQSDETRADKIKKVINPRKEYILSRLPAATDYFIDIETSLNTTKKGETQTIAATHVEASKLESSYEETVKKLIDKIAKTQTNPKPTPTAGVVVTDTDQDAKRRAPTEGGQGIVRVSSIEVRPGSIAHVASFTDTTHNETRTELRGTPSELSIEAHWKAALDKILNNDALNNDALKNDLIEEFPRLMAKEGKELFGIDKSNLAFILKDAGVDASQAKDFANKIANQYKKNCERHLYNKKDDIPSSDVFKLAIALVEEQRKRNPSGTIVIPKGIKNGPVFVEAIRLYCMHKHYDFKDRSEWKNIVSANISSKKVKVLEKQLADDPGAYGYSTEFEKHRQTLTEGSKKNPPKAKQNNKRKLAPSRDSSRRSMRRISRRVSSSPSRQGDDATPSPTQYSPISGGVGYVGDDYRLTDSNNPDNRSDGSTSTYNALQLKARDSHDSRKSTSSQEDENKDHGYDTTPKP